MSSRISRKAYAEMFGPTTGDRVRLADTDLWIEIEKDYAVYGEEVKFGGGKVIRDGMGQGQLSCFMVADTVITNAVIIDYWGIVKADIGIKDGLIMGIGKAGNPDIQPGVTIPIGAGTEIIAGEGKIVTAGGIDSHIHFICPQQIEEALRSPPPERLFEHGVQLPVAGQSPGNVQHAEHCGVDCRCRRNQGCHGYGHESPYAQNRKGRLRHGGFRMLVQGGRGDIGQHHV